jgi:predicted nuclease of predicted toxin-antitoxin system
MKLFFDHNLSPRLVQRLADLYPNASHVALVGLERASDNVVWTYAQTNDYIIVTKDSDFNDMSVLRGFPPKVIWLQLGNCTTDELETALRRNHTAISDFSNDRTIGVLGII